jgi:speckle-type POZ protein
MASKMNLFFGIRAVRDVSDVGTPKMIVPYEWTLENVEEGPMIIASKMISFRGQKVFRVGLKNHALKPVLFFMAIDLNKIGMKVEDVMYGIQGSGLGPAIMEQMFTEDILGKGSLQLFTVSLAEKVVGNCTFMFRIVIEGTDSRFSYQLSDCLAKDQLWTALKSQLHLADVEFIVKNKKISAHKAILAARSQVFAAEFEKKQPGKDSPHQIPIETGVEPSTVENFLHFVYTGEPKGTLVDEELLKLAKHYQLTTLTSLCQVALSKIETTQMTKFMASLHSGVDTLSSSRIM